MKTTYLVLGAVAIIAASAAPAAAKHAQTTTLSIDGFCNVETLVIQPGSKGSTIRETDTCDDNFGTGLSSSIKGVGKFANFDWVSSKFPGQVFDLVFTLPLQTGNTVTLNYTVDGINQTTLGPYTYTLATDGAKSPRAGTKSITSLIPRR